MSVMASVSLPGMCSSRLAPARARAAPAVPAQAMHSPGLFRVQVPGQGQVSRRAGGTAGAVALAAGGGMAAAAQARRSAPLVAASPARRSRREIAAPAAALPPSPALVADVADGLEGGIQAGG
jgi:hypothetical protein